MDIRTLILVLAIGNLVFGIVLILFQLRQEYSLRNPFWPAAKFLQCGGWLLLAGRGVLADSLSFTLGNFCLLTGFAYECWAIYRISDRPVPLAYQILGIVYALLGAILATPLTAAGRIAAASFLVTPIIALSAWAMLFGGPQRSPLRTYLSLSIGLLAVATCARGSMALMATEEFFLFSQNPIQLISFS